MNQPLMHTPSARAAPANNGATQQRVERRVAHRVPCRVRTPAVSHGKSVSVVGQTVNLSANGMAVQLGHPIDAGASVEVFLPHLDGEPTRLLGTVAHSRRVLSGTFEIGIWIAPEYATT